MAVELSEVLNSGDISDIRLSNNLWFEAADVPVAEDMFMRVGLGGGVSLYKAPDQDVHWEDTDNTQQLLDTVATEMLSVTVDQDLTTDNGSWSTSMRLDNTSNQSRTVQLVVTVDGVASAPQDYDLDKGEVDKQILLGGAIGVNINSGSIISVSLDTDGAGVQLRGDLFITRLKVTKAQAAPVTMSVDVLDSFDWNLLPTSEPTESGKLWIKANGSLRVSS